MGRELEEYIIQIFKKFNPYIPDMMLMGMKSERFSTASELIRRTDYIEKDFFQFMEVWFDNWLETSYKPWKKIRNENPETIWARYKDMDYGEDFQEIRELNRFARLAIEAFDDKKNYFLKCNVPKRSKKNVLGSEEVNGTGQTSGTEVRG